MTQRLACHRNSIACAKGKFQSRTGQSQCDNCATGTYSDSTARLSCIQCALGFNSRAGATVCELASEGYYLDPLSADGIFSEVTTCPPGALCNGDLDQPQPQKGYWVDRSKLEYSADVLTCSRLTCSGSNSNFTGNNSCWNLNAYGDTGNVWQQMHGLDCRSDGILW